MQLDGLERFIQKEFIQKRREDEDEEGDARKG